MQQQQEEERRKNIEAWTTTVYVCFLARTADLVGGIPLAVEVHHVFRVQEDALKWVNRTNERLTKEGIISVVYADYKEIRGFDPRQSVDERLQTKEVEK